MNNKFKIFLLLFTSLLFHGSEIMAQNKRMIKSKSYHLLLKKMLKHDVPEISVDSLNKLRTNVLLLDTREKDEYNVSRLKNAKWVGYKTFSLDSVQNIDKTKPIVVYCSVGYRSEKIAEKLIAAGFTDVQNLYGGIFEWKNKKFDLYNRDGITDDVHPYNATWGLWLKKGRKVYHSPTVIQ